MRFSVREANCVNALQLIRRRCQICENTIATHSLFRRTRIDAEGPLAPIVVCRPLIKPHYKHISICRP